MNLSVMRVQYFETLVKPEREPTHFRLSNCDENDTEQKGYFYCAFIELQLSVFIRIWKNSLGVFSFLHL